MDPLSITATCVGLASTITRTSLVVISFVKDVRSARSDLDVISRELSSLKTILELLAEDVNDSTTQSIPQTLQKQITGIITNCTGVVVDIEKTLVKHEGGRTNKAANWVAFGKNDVAKLQLSLEAHKSALEIALDMVTLTLTREIKADTQEILDDTSAIKQDTAQILAEIARLQEQLPRNMNQRSAGFMLERYLDNLTSYAETVSNPFLDGSGGSRPTSRPGSSGEDALVNQYSNAVPEEYYEPVSGESSLSMMTPSPAEKLRIKNDEEATHRNMQEYEYRPAGIEEPTDSDGTAHGISSTNLEPRPDIEEPADDDTLTSVDSRESSVSLKTPSEAGKFQIENDEEAAHRNMQEYEYRPASIQEPIDSDGTAHGVSSANLEPRPNIEEPADYDILTSVDDEIYTKDPVETKGMENLGFARFERDVDTSRHFHTRFGPSRVVRISRPQQCEEMFSSFPGPEGGRERRALYLAERRGNRAFPPSILPSAADTASPYERSRSYGLPYSAILSPPSSAECNKVPEKPSFKGTIDVRVSGSSLWRRRHILIDDQGYLTSVDHRNLLKILLRNGPPIRPDDD